MGEFCRFYKSDVQPGVWWKVYEALDESGRLQSSFPHLRQCSWDAFQDITHGKDRYSWILTFRDEIAGVVYLSDMAGTAAYVHFAFLPVRATRTMGRLPVPVAAGRFAVASILRDKKDGEYILDTLIGITPISNKAAVNMIMRCGAVRVGEIPGAVFEYGRDRNGAGVVTYYTRESTPDEWCGL